MYYFLKTIILCLFMTIILGCSKKAEKKIKSQRIELTKKVTFNKKNTKEIISFKEDTTTSLEEKLEKRFGKAFTEEVVFNDNTKVSIKTPLKIAKPNHKTSTFYIRDDVQSIYDFECDSMGIVLKDGKYHPTVIAKIALKAVNDYKDSKSEVSKEIFLNHLKWIEDNFYETEYYGFWYFTFAMPEYYLDAGWPSAYSQGLLLNVCLEAYKLTGDKKYATFIEKALKAFLVPVEHGGFLRNWEENELWFEEYPTKLPSRVLNGNMSGLEGVYNIYQELGIELAKKIFISGVETIKNHLEDYNTQYSSRYNLADWKNQLSKENYHEGHVIQLLRLYKLTGDETFKKYAKIFLENDHYDFLRNSRYKLPSKFESIKANHTIDSLNHGIKNVSDELWAYGKFWSSYKKTEMIIDFGKMRPDIHAITLYHVSERSKDVDFEIYGYNEKKNKWEYIQKIIPKFSKDKISGYNETGGYKVFIEHHKIFEPLNAQKVKLVFDATHDNIIALREINFIFDQTKELNYLLNLVEERMNNDEIKNYR